MDTAFVYILRVPHRSRRQQQALTLHFFRQNKTFIRKKAAATEHLLGTAAFGGSCCRFNFHF